MLTVSVRRPALPGCVLTHFQKSEQTKQKIDEVDKNAPIGSPQTALSYLLGHGASLLTSRFGSILAPNGSGQKHRLRRRWLADSANDFSLQQFRTKLGCNVSCEHRLVGFGRNGVENHSHHGSLTSEHPLPWHAEGILLCDESENASLRRAKTNLVPLFIICDRNVRLWDLLGPSFHWHETAAGVGQVLFQALLGHVEGLFTF